MAETKFIILGNASSRGAPPNDDKTCLWTTLPRELQHKVLAYLPLQNLFQGRCVCKGWCDVICCSDFCSLYDETHRSECPNLAIFYRQLSNLFRVEWSTYNYVEKMWLKMPSMLPSCLTLDHTDICSVSECVNSVGGLLYLQHFCKEDMQGERSWLVWNPFTNKRKKLPPCNQIAKNKNSAVFVHGFVTNESTKTYKILMAHITKKDYYDQQLNKSLVTVIYDSATGVWAESLNFTLKQPLYPPLEYHPNRSKGLLCNGVIYFVATRMGVQSTLLLSYDLKSEKWHEGRLMAVMQRRPHEYCLFEWTPATREWVDVGIQIPVEISKVVHEFEYYTVIFASGNDLVILNYDFDNRNIRIAMYERAKKKWRIRESHDFPFRSYRHPVGEVVEFTPRLDWIP